MTNSGQFQPGNTLTSLRVHNNGGRPPSQIKQLQQELEDYPERTRQLMDKIYHLARHGESEKIKLSACIDYLDRVGFRAPKESTLTIQGMIAIGTPEDYRRAALLLSRDRETEQALLAPGTIRQATPAVPEIVESIIIGTVDNDDNDNKDV